MGLIFKKKLFFSASFLLLSLPAHAQEDFGQLLFDSFAARCQSYGTNSQQVLAETRSLISSLETILNDPECRDPFNPVYNSLFVVQDQLEFLSRGVGDEKQKDLEDKIDRLAFELSLVDPGDVELMQFLSYELAQTKLELFDQDYEDREQRRNNRHIAIEQMTNYIIQVDSALANQTRCFERHKTLPLQVAGHLLAISGGFFDSSLNLALTVAGRAFSSFFRFIGEININRQIDRLQAVTNEAGISCALEALEQNYCDLQDRQSVIDVQQDYIFEPNVPKAWQGFHLLTRDFPRVVRFLRRVETSTDPRSEPQGNSRGSYEELEGSYHATIARLQGKIGGARDKLAFIPANDIATQETTLRNLVSEMANSLFQGIFSEAIPGGDYYRAQLWLRIGTPSPSKTSEESFYDKLSQLDSEVDPRDAVRQRNINLIEKNLQQIIQAAGKQLALERSQTKNPDQQGGMASWTERTQLEESAGAVIQEIAEYLGALIEDWNEHSEWFSEPIEATQRDQIDLVIDLKQRFESVIDILKLANSEIEDELLQKEKETYISDQQRLFDSLLKEVDVFRDELLIEEESAISIEAMFAVENAEDLDSLEKEIREQAFRYKVLMRQKLRAMRESYPQVDFEKLGEITLLAVRVGLLPESVLEQDYSWEVPAFGGKVSSKEILQYKQDLIFKEMVLRERDTVIGDRFEQIVQMDLEKRLRAGFLQDREHLDSFVRLSNDELFATLLPGNQVDLERLREDLVNAESMVKGNTDAFFMNFQRSILKAIKDLEAQAERHQEGVYGVSQLKIARLCILSLNYPEISEFKDIVKHCSGKILGYDAKGMMKKDRFGKPIALVFDDIITRHPEERKCLYRRHRREIELAELLQHRPPRFFSSVDYSAPELQPVLIPIEEAAWQP